MKIDIFIIQCLIQLLNQSFNSYIVLTTCQALFTNINSCYPHNLMKYYYCPILVMRKLRHRKAGYHNSNQGGLPSKFMLLIALLQPKNILQVLASQLFFPPFLFFIFFWLCWVFVSVQGLSLVAASGGHSSSRCVGLSLSQPLLLQSTGSRCAGSVIVAHGPSCSAACGIFPDQGSNPCPLHWQADSQPLHHQGSPPTPFLIYSPKLSKNGAPTF